MERLTDSKTAADLKSNYEGLRAAGMPRDMDTERYIKLAEYENKEDKKHYEKPKILYVCDPNKNKWCSKWGCFKNGGECSLTRYKECAMTDENGNAIKEGE